MTEDLVNPLAQQGFTIYPNSLRSTDSNFQTFVAKHNGQKLVGIVQKPKRKHFELFSPVTSEIKLTSGETVSLHPLTWGNYEKLRTVIDIAPTPAGNQPSFGTGDRLGLVSAAHVSVLSKYPVFPIIAQQSPRELAKTGRDFQHVLLKAVMGVLETGYTGQYGADADHIKDEHHLLAAIEAGYTMYTIDLSNWLQDPKSNSTEHLSMLSRKIIAENSGLCINGYTINGDGLVKSALIYEKALTQVKSFHEILKDNLDDFDLEISLDEGPRDTTAEDHFFIAEYLHRNGIDFTSLAPKFPGQFQKGIDYVGNLEALRKSLITHAAICGGLGGYRLSLHSGSDKFSIYPMFSEITDGQFHIKTSGTSWLQAVLIIAKKNAKLFTELYKLSLDNLEESNKAYNIPINVDNLPPTPPEDLLTFLSQPDVRKLLHISYGILLEQRKDSIFEVLRANEEEHYLCVSRNIEHHLKLLF
jgi:hypothetical protein